MGRSAAIMNAAHLKELVAENLPDGSGFILIGRWDTGEFRRVYDKRTVLGNWAAATPLARHPRQRICAFQSEFIRDLLDARRTIQPRG